MKFSVIIPVYGVERFLEECVNSILSQTYQEYEIILVDDGSPDNCPTICDNYLKKDSRIKVIHKENGGISSARNEGLLIAKGEYIIFVDSDDYICDLLFLEKISRRIEEYQEEVVLFGCKIEYADGRFSISRNNYNLDTINKKDKDKTLEELFNQNNFPGAAWIMCVKKEIIDFNGFRFRIGVTAEDFEWIVKILLAAKTIGAINGIQYVYRKREGSITSRPNISGVYGTTYAISYYLDSLKRYTGLSKFLSRIFLIALMGINRLENKERRNAISILARYQDILLISNQKIEYFIIKLIGFKNASYVIKFIYNIIR